MLPEHCSSSSVIFHKLTKKEHLMLSGDLRDLPSCCVTRLQHSMLKPSVIYLVHRSASACACAFVGAYLCVQFKRFHLIFFFIIIGWFQMYLVKFHKIRQCHSHYRAFSFQWSGRLHLNEFIRLFFQENFLRLWKWFLS